MTELGSRLRMAREEKSISLDELQTMTKIQKRYLVGIEEGNYDSMPGKFYVRAFIKQYAEAVGLQPEELFEEYKNDIPPAYETDYPEQLSRVQTRKPVSEGAAKFLQILPKLIVVLVVVAALFGIWYLVQNMIGIQNSSGETDNPDVSLVQSNENKPPSKKKDKNGKEDGKPKDEDSDKDKNEDKPAAGQQLEAVSQSGKLTTYKLSGAEKLVVAVNGLAGGQSWVEIHNLDGKSLFAGMIGEGQSQEVDMTGEKGALVVTGDSRYTDILVNGEKLEYKVAPEQLVHQKIQIESEGQQQQ